jgi:hypothetical protein
VSDVLARRTYDTIAQRHPPRGLGGAVCIWYGVCDDMESARVSHGSR